MRLDEDELDNEERLAALTSLSGDDVDDEVDWTPAARAATVAPAARPEYGPASPPPSEAGPASRLTEADAPPVKAAPPAAGSTWKHETPRTDARTEEKLRMLEELASGDERVREAFGRDKRQAQSAALIDAIAAGVSGRQTHAPSLPSEAGLESQLQSRRAALLKAYAASGARPGVPAEYYQAQMKRWAGEDERARAKADAETKTAGEKRANEKVGAERDATSLDAEKSAYFDSALGRQATEGERSAISKMTRKGFEDHIKRQAAFELVRMKQKHGSAGLGDGKQLPATQVTELADYQTAGKQVDDLMASFEGGAAGGMFEKVKGKLGEWTGTNIGPQEYLDQMKATAQVVGTILEGGKLSESDLPRYMDLMPKPGDSKERATSKRDNIKRLLADKRAGRIKGLRDSGYNAKDTAAPESAAATPAVASPAETRVIGGKTFRKEDDEWVTDDG